MIPLATSPWTKSLTSFRARWSALLTGAGTPFWMSDIICDASNSTAASKPSR